MVKKIIPTSYVQQSEATNMHTQYLIYFNFYPFVKNISHVTPSHKHTLWHAQTGDRITPFLFTRVYLFSKHWS